MARALELLPDEAVLKVMLHEEESRAECDNIVKASAVDAKLLEEFHRAVKQDRGKLPASFKPKDLRTRQ